MSDLVLLTADEVAAKLKVHVNTVYANTDLPRVEVSPGTIRWIESQVDQYLLGKVSRKPKAPKKTVMRRKFTAVAND